MAFDITTARPLTSIKEKTIKEQVSERGSYWDSISKDLQSQNKLNKTLGVLKALGTPVNLPLSAIAGAELELATSDKPPVETLKRMAISAGKGLIGLEQPTIGDVYKSVGVNPILAGMADLGAGIGMASFAGKATRSLTPFTSTLSRSDKNLIQQGTNLIKNTFKAVEAKGAKLNKLFQSVDNIAVDGNKILEAIPQPFLNQLDEVAQGLFKKSASDIIATGNIHALRTIKQLYGKINPSRFGAEAKGKITGATIDLYNKGYANLSNLMKEALNTSGKPTKEISKLLQAEKEFSNLAKAQDVIQKSLIDPHTGWVTKTGAAAKKLFSNEDVTFKKALEEIRKSGVDVKSAKSAIQAMADFERWKAFKELTGKITRYAVLGGAAGTAGATAIRNTIGKSNIQTE